MGIITRENMTCTYTKESKQQPLEHYLTINKQILLWMNQILKIFNPVHLNWHSYNTYTCNIILVLFFHWSILSLSFVLNKEKDVCIHYWWQWHQIIVIFMLQSNQTLMRTQCSDWWRAMSILPCVQVTEEREI